MKSQKFFLILIAVVGLAIFEGSTKYSDGPSISFRSRTERVANNWKVENYKINNTDWTSLVSSYMETFLKQGAYSYSWGSLSGTGHWSFQNNDQEIQLSSIDSQASRKLIILRLEENPFGITTLDGNDRNEVHLIPE